MVNPQARGIFVFFFSGSLSTCKFLEPVPWSQISGRTYRENKGDSENIGGNRATWGPGLRDVCTPVLCTRSELD